MFLSLPPGAFEAEGLAPPEAGAAWRLLDVLEAKARCLITPPPPSMHAVSHSLREL